MATVRKTKKDIIREELAKERGPVKKPRKRRKPMTEEQKQAAAERLAKAREKRMKENPPQYKSIHPEVLKLPEDDPLSMQNVKEWIKTQKDLLSTARSEARAGLKGAESKVARIEGYIKNLETYLRDGVYLDSYWGEFGENKMKQVCIAMAYNKDGTPKRSHGTYYPDLGYVYGEEPEWAKEPEGLEAFYE